MMQKSFFIILLFLTSYSYSQSVISSGGNTKTVISGSDGMTVSWTIGETVIASLGNSNNNLTQGFHQPLMTELFPTSIEKENILDMIAYPNPTYDKVLFKGGDPNGIYHIRLVDKLGKVLLQTTVPATELEVEMLKYNNGSYLIELIEDKTERRVIFNVVKSSE